MFILVWRIPFLFDGSEVCEDCDNCKEYIVIILNMLFRKARGGM